jgi:hypothetical protein
MRSLAVISAFRIQRYQPGSSEHRSLAATGGISSGLQHDAGTRRLPPTCWPGSTLAKPTMVSPSALPKKAGHQQSPGLPQYRGANTRRMTIAQPAISPAGSICAGGTSRPLARSRPISMRCGKNGIDVDRRQPRVYLDANVFVAAFEHVGARSDHAWWIMRAIERGEIAAGTSEITLAEVLVKPFEVGATDLVD